MGDYRWLFQMIYPDRTGRVIDFSPSNSTLSRALANFTTLVLNRCARKRHNASWAAWNIQQIIADIYRIPVQCIVYFQ